MYDVIIVGGGVAGCYLASKINPKYKVLLIERNKKIVPKDSGIVSTHYTKFFGKYGQHIIKHNIRKIDCVSPSGITFSLSSENPYAYILRRKRFSLFLRKNAARNAEIVIGNARNIEHHSDHVSVRTSGGKYEAKMLVGCDGANSIARKSLGIESPRLALGIMVKTKRKLEGDISVFFNKYFSPDFFSWIIPQNNEYGMMTAIRPADYFSYFVKNMYLPSGRMYAYTIPFTYTRSFWHRTILVGDACGQNKPLTGGGIMFSLVGANHAANMINDALNERRFDSDFLSYYEKYWKKDLAWEIEKQFLIRMIYRKLTNKEIDKMFLDFGPAFSAINSFDYDKLGNLWWHFPKIKLAKFLLTKAPRLLS